MMLLGTFTVHVKAALLGYFLCRKLPVMLEVT